MEHILDIIMIPIQVIIVFIPCIISSWPASAHEAAGTHYGSA